MARALLCGLVLILFSASSSPAAPSDFDTSCPENAGGTDLVLLDTYNYVALPWDSNSLDGDNETWVIKNGSNECRQMVDTCTVESAPQNNTLVTQYISTPSQPLDVQIIVDFEPGTCPTGAFENPTCPSSFSLYVFNTPNEVPSGMPSFGDFSLVRNPVVSGDAIVVMTTMAGLYLAFLDMGACVSITRVRVTYRMCPATTINLVEYPEGFSGGTVMGMCVANSTSGVTMFSAQCSLTGSFSFLSGGNCTCTEGYEVMGNQCSVCTADYYTSGGDCEKCPANSERPSSMSNDTCLCLGDTRTSDNVGTSTGLACNGCADNFFLRNATACAQCPSSSTSTALNDTSCTCNEGTTLLDGTRLTTGGSCSACALNYFREGTSGQCMPCPANSVRESMATECSCTMDYVMDTNDNCLPVVGFESSTAEVTEGDQVNLLIRLSAAVDAATTVTLNIVSPGRAPEVDVMITETVEFERNATTKMATVSVRQDDVALQGDELQVSITATPGFVVGGTVSFGTLYASIGVRVKDEDSLVVGFTMSEVTFDKSDTNVAVSIIARHGFASNFDLRVMGNDDSVVVVKNPLVTFTANLEPNSTVMVPLEIQKSGQVVLSLELANQSIAGIKIGDANTEDTVIVVVDAGPGFTFTIEAIIGVCVAGAALALLLLALVILCLCICRLRVNRQGFYPTYEDKTSEPPTMLRYSASLRSISSQTIVPITEGRAITKENEFYV